MEKTESSALPGSARASPGPNGVPRVAITGSRPPENPRWPQPPRDTGSPISPRPTLPIEAHENARVTRAACDCRSHRAAGAPRGAREWEGELWYWLTSTPDAAAFSARVELARHCWGAVVDAFYLRFDRDELAATASRILGCPGLPVLAAVVSLVIVGTASGWFARTRRAFEAPPYPEAQRIAILSQAMPYLGQPAGVPPAKVALWERESRTVRSAAVYVWYRTVSGSALRELPAVKVGAGFFQILRSGAALGRLFQPSDATRCRDCAVVSYDYWSHGLDRDPGIVGRTIMVDGGPARVIGVLPRDFWFLEAAPAVWTLYIPGETWREWPEPMAGAICALRPGATTAAAQRELRALAAADAAQSDPSLVTVAPVASALLRPVGGFWRCSDPSCWWRRCSPSPAGARAAPRSGC